MEETKTALGVAPPGVMREVVARGAGSGNAKVPFARAQPLREKSMTTIGSLGFCSVMISNELVARVALQPLVSKSSR